MHLSLLPAFNFAPVYLLCITELEPVSNVVLLSSEYIENRIPLCVDAESFQHFIDGVQLIRHGRSKALEEALYRLLAYMFVLVVAYFQSYQFNSIPCQVLILYSAKLCLS